MYYCIRCKQTHDSSNEQVIFRTGFYHADSKRMNVGYCQAEAAAPRRDSHRHLQHEKKIRWINRSKLRMLKI
ncbi:DUF3973 domain-containing protein [Cohnella pontilimi]